MLFAFVAVAATTATAQDARGYRGEWNSWGYDGMTLESGVWRVTVQANASGSRNFKIAHDNWNYEWTSRSAVSLDTITSFNHFDGADSSINGVNNRYYTITMQNVNQGNAGDVIVQETENSPVTISSVSHDTMGDTGEITVRITTSGTPSSGERIFVRYTTDSWSSSSFVEASGSGTSWTASWTHGDSDAGDEVEFYVMTTKFSSPSHGDADLQTIRLANNGGDNWSYTVGPNARTVASTIDSAYLGDQNVEITVEAWQDLDGTDRSFATVFMRHSNSNLTTGTTAGTGRDPGASSDDFYAEAPQFTQTGTWYWTMRISYGIDNDYWLMDDDTWHRIYDIQPEGSRLEIEVDPLPDADPVSAQRNSSNPSSQIDLTHTRQGPGDGFNVLIVRRAGSAVDWDPTQGTSYSNGQDLGGGRTVVRGSLAANSFEDTGLDPDTTYHYKIFSENWSYYSDGETASATTLASEPASNPNNLSFTSVGATSMTINWGNVIGNAIVVLREGSAPNADPVDGSTYTADSDFTSATSSTIGTGGQVVYIGSGTSVTVTDLTPDTEYYVRIYNFNGSGGSENYRQTGPLAGSESTVEPHVWTGGGANANWTTGANWSDGAPPGASDVAIFYSGIGSGTTINIDTASSVGGILFRSTATSALTFSGSALTVGSSGIESESGSAAHTFNNNIALDAGQTWDLAENLTVGGVISGSGNLTKAGAGRLTLSGNNTFTGNVQLNAGIIEIQHVNGLGNASGSMTVATGATLELNAGGNYAQPLTINGTGVGGNGALRKMDSGTRRYDAPITLGSDARINVEGGTLELRDDVDLDGNTLYLGGNMHVDMAAGSALLNASRTSGDGAIFKDGAGFFLLRPSGGQPSGSITIDNGELRLIGNVPAGGTLTMADGTEVMSSSSAGRTITKNILIAGDVVLGAAATRTGALTINGTVNLDGDDREINAPVDHTINGVVSNGGLTKVGAGRLTLTGNNSFSGDLNIDEGFVRLDGDIDAGGTGDINVADGATLELRHNDTWTQDINLAGLGVASGPSIDVIRNGTIGGDVTLTGNAWIRRTDNFTGNLEIDGTLHLGSHQLDITMENRNVIMDTSSGITGTGTLYIDAGDARFEYRPDSSHTGSIILHAGEMRQTLANMPSGGTFTMGDGTRFSSDGTSTRTINKNTIIEGDVALGGTAASRNGDIIIAGNVDLDGANRTLSIPYDSMIEGDISNGGLTKAGSGTLTLDGANTYSGGTTVSAGTLVGTTTSLQGNIVNNSALIFNQSGDGTYAGQISGTGTLTKQGNGTVTLTGNSSYSGDTTVSAGGLVVDGIVDNSDFTVASGATLFGDGEIGELTLSGTVRPGDASTIGSLDVAALTLNNGSTARFKIGDASNTSDRDFIANGGTATINATVTIAIDDSELSNFNAANNYSWILIEGGISSAANFSLNDTSHWSTSLAGGDFDLVASGNNLVLEFTASIAEPTVQATDIQFSAIGMNQMTVEWTTGNGANAIVVAREGSAVNANPSDNTTYTANTTFGSGSEIGTGNFVVFNGSGTSVTVTGLDPATVYHFRVYEYNGSGGTENYFTDTATGNPASQETMHAAPTTQASAITFSGINAGSLTGINFTDGNGSSRIVVAKAGSAVDELPVDGTSYSSGANDSFSNGDHLGGGNYVVHVGSGPFSVSSLSAETVYHFRVFEFNGSGVTANYNADTATGNPASQTTLATQPSSAVTDLQFTSIGVDTFTISWTKGGGSDNTLILVKTSGITTAPSDATSYTADTEFGEGSAIDGAYVVYNGSGTSATVTDLDPATQYYIRAYPFNGSAGAENYRVGTPANINGFTLATAPSTQASNIDFASVTINSMNVSWDNGNGAGRLVIARADDPPSGGPVAGTTYTADNDFSGSGSVLGDGKVVYIGTGNSFTLSGLAASTTYHLQVFEYSGSGASINYNTSTATDNPNSQATLGVDPPTDPASNLLVGDVTTSSIELTWTRGNGDDVLVVARQGSAAEQPANDTAYSANAAFGSGDLVGSASRAVYNDDGTTVTVTSLSPATQYHFAAFEYLDYGSGQFQYRTADAPTVSRWTLATEPADHVTGFDADDPTSTTIDLSWTVPSPAPDGYIILRRSGAAPTAVPADGVSYNEGQGIGDSVVAAFITSGATDERTVVNLAPETTYHFAIFPFNWASGEGESINYKTDPAAPTASETTVEALIILDQFDYTLSSNLNGLQGGTGWDGDDWSVIWENEGSATATIQSGSLDVPDGYPEADGNHVRFGQFQGSDAFRFRATREFDEPFSEGRIYAAAVLRYDWSNPNVFIGLSLMEGSTERAFMGRPFQNDQEFGADSFGGGMQMAQPPRQFFGGNDYLVIIRYDFDTYELKGLIYPGDGGEVPAQAPATWHIEATVASDWITQIDGLRISGGNELGYGYFDEVRVANTWAGLLGTAASPEAEAPTVQAGNFVFFNEAQDRMTVRVDRGNGTRVLILASEGSPVDAEPAEGFSYDADAEFGEGDEIETGNFVVYDGSDAFPEFVMTGLTGETTYHFRAFEYNTAAGEKYNTDEVGGNPSSYTTLSPPEDVSVGLAGTTATQLSWTQWNDRWVMVVYSVNSPVTFTPTDGVDYTTASSITGGTILRDGKSSETSYEHTGLTEDDTIYYRFFSRNNDFYSAPVERQITLTLPTLLLYDGFANSSGTMQGQGGGTGWNRNWDIAGFDDNIAQYSSGSLPGLTAAAASGNKAVLWGDVDGRFIDVTREMSSAINNGTYYLSWRQNHQFGGNENYAGLRLLSSSGSQLAHIGKWYSDTLRIYDYAANAHSGSNVTLNAGSGNDYIIVVKLELDSEGSDTISVARYRSGEHLIGEEPVEWPIVRTMNIDNIGQIRLSAGANTDHQIGAAYFDEIRLGENWTEVMRFDGQSFRQMMEEGPVPELIFIGRDYDPETAPFKNWITDAELADEGDPIDFAVRWTSPHGVFLTNNTANLNTNLASIGSSQGNVVPNWDPLRSDEQGPLATGFDRLFTGFIGHNGATVVTTYHVNAFSGTDDAFDGWDIGDQFFITVSAQTFPSGSSVSAPSGGNDVPDRRAITVNIPLEFFVIDDDEDPPELRGFSRELTDADMRAGFTFTGEVRDAGSGVLSDSNTFWLVNPEGTAVIENQLFSTRPTNTGARINFGTLSHVIDPGADYADNMLGAWTATVWAADADDDRPDDTAYTNRNFVITVVDDDTEPPQVGANPLEILLDDTALDAFSLTEDLLAGWNFNNDFDRLGVSHGSGTLTLDLLGDDARFPSPGVANNAVPGDEPERLMRIENANNNGSTITFELDMTMRTGLEMSFAASRNADGFQNNEIHYSLNGSDWHLITTFTPGTTIGTVEPDFSAVSSALDNQSTVYIRITLLGGTGAEALYRMDNVQFVTSLQPFPLVAGWNFNDSGDRLAVSHGEGTFINNLPGSIGYFGGTTLNAYESDPAGEAFRPSGTGNNGNDFQFVLDMSRREDLTVSFATWRSSAGYNDIEIAYSTDGDSFTAVDSFDPPTSSTAWSNGEVLWYEMPAALNNQETVYIRFTLDGATSGGVVYFDNFQFRASSVQAYEITDAQLATVTGSNPLRFRFNVYDVDSGILRGSSLTGPREGLGMAVTVPGLFDDDPDFDVGASDSDTTVASAITEWRETTLSPAVITDMYDIGQLQPITAFVSDDDFDRPNDNLVLENQHFGHWRVSDDDVRPPELRNLTYRGQAANPLHPFLVFTNETRIGMTGNTTPNAQMDVHDSDLRFAGTRNLEFAFGVIDRDSGVARPGEFTAGNVLSMSIGNFVVSNTANFNPGVSGSNWTNATTTNVWTFADGYFSYETIGDMYEERILPVVIDLWDDDNDRTDDQSGITLQAGRIRIVDDDIRPPDMGPLTLNGDTDPHNLFVMNFSSHHGWTNFAVLGYADRINEDPVGGVWATESIALSTAFGDRMGGPRVPAFQGDSDVGRIIMPERENLGTLFVWARTAALSNRTRTVRLEGTEQGESWALNPANDGDWEYDFGTRTVDWGGEYELLTWEIEEPGPMILRIRMTDTNDGVLWMDDFTLTRRAAWTNVENVEISFDEAVDESGIYRYGLITETEVPPYDRGTNVYLATHWSATAASGFTWSMIPEGVVTGFVYAADDDNDRPNDRMRNAGIPLVQKIDRTPPETVSGLEATDADGLDLLHFTDIDETSEIGVRWDPFVDEATAAGPRSDNEPLSPWDTYIVTYYETDAGGTALPNAVTQTLTRSIAGWTNILHDFALTNIVLSDLAFDSYYRIGIQGRDEAGNIGDVEWVIGNTDRFVVTQGLARAESESEIYWTAAPGRDYDLIRTATDQLDYTDGLQQQSAWSLVKTVQANMADDVDSIQTGRMRFYRGTPSGRWESPTRPVASEEVYVAKPITLRRGQNWVALPGIPDTNTVGRIFNGARDLPSGQTAAQSTRIFWFPRVENVSNPTNSVGIWLSGSNWNQIDPNVSAEDMTVDLSDGFIIQIPTNAPNPTYTFLYVGRVPSSAMTNHVQTQEIKANQAANLVNFRLPRRMHPADLNLVQTNASGHSVYGMRAGLGVSQTIAATNRADAIWALNRSAQGPSAIIYYYDGVAMNGSFGGPGWYRVGDGGPSSDNRLSSDFRFQPDDAIVIRSFGSTTNWIWTNTIPYAPPDRFLD